MIPERRLLSADIMTRNPITIHQDERLRVAVEQMRTNHIRHLPVMNSERQIVGILTDRDCRRALGAAYLDDERPTSSPVPQVRVRTLMTPAPVVVEPETPAETAVSLMLVQKIGCLPVVRSETLVGIITRSDVLIAFMTLLRDGRLQTNR